MFRALVAMLAAFLAFTAVWVLLGLLNTGDAFPQGPARRLQGLILVAPPVAGWAGWRWGGRRLAAALGLLLLPAAWFWAFAPDGWWAEGPGGRAAGLRVAARPAPDLLSPGRP